MHVRARYGYSVAAPAWVLAPTEKRPFRVKIGDTSCERRGLAPPCDPPIIIPATNTAGQAPPLAEPSRVIVHGIPQETVCC